jgi:methylglutaconyl-CoA hydratase
MAMTGDSLLSRVDADGTGWLTLNRPELHNAFDDTLIARITEALRAFERDELVRAVAIDANGKSFSAGADLNWMRRMAGYTFDENVADAMRLAEMLATLSRLCKPTLAVVQGPALGGGAGLVAACDLAIAAETARFAFTEVRFGLLPATISPHVIAAIGRRQATRYLLTAEVFSAAEALRIGLVHRVVPAADLAAAAGAMLGDLAAGGPEALAAVKDLIRAVAGRPLDRTLMEDTAERIARARTTDEARARIAAFLEKRAGGAGER